MNVASKSSTVQDKYLPIYLDALRIDSIVDFDLYLKIGRDLILYRASDLPFTDRTRHTLLENNVETLFVPTSEREQYQNYIESNISMILNDQSISTETKSGIIYDSTKLLVRDVLANPTLGENIQRSKTMVESSVGYILKEKDAFHNLIKVMSFDYYTYTHSVNVCTFSVAFARHLGFADEEFLNNLGVGALLHDVGKTKVSDRILNKRGRLSPLEMEIIKRHPQWGVDLMEETDMLEKEAYYPIIQHHEREDRSGYPHGHGSDDIHIYGKIVAIADTFDAMTTHRVYQPAKETFPALKTMFGCDDAYDRELLEKFAALMGPTGIADI
ncbi:MAG: HD domain-containing protein [candidate division Zixibacteria bacterium]|nr:HD domain-containing protein [candidate division Zixibacteria bacterium]